MNVGDMLGYAVGVLGLSPSSFYELTPAELISISKQFNDYKLREIDMIGAVMYNAVGLAFNGKKYQSIFDKVSHETKPQTKRITKEEATELVEYMAKKFKL